MYLLCYAAAAGQGQTNVCANVIERFTCASAPIDKWHHLVASHAAGTENNARACSFVLLLLLCGLMHVRLCADKLCTRAKVRCVCLPLIIFHSPTRPVSIEQFVVRFSAALAHPELGPDASDRAYIYFDYVHAQHARLIKIFISRLCGEWCARAGVAFRVAGAQCHATTSVSVLISKLIRSHVIQSTNRVAPPPAMRVLFLLYARTSMSINILYDNARDLAFARHSKAASSSSSSSLRCRAASYWCFGRAPLMRRSVSCVGCRGCGCRWQICIHSTCVPIGRTAKVVFPVHAPRRKRAINFLMRCRRWSVCLCVCSRSIIGMLGVRAVKRGRYASACVR